MKRYTELTVDQIIDEAQALRIFSGYALTMEEAMERICQALGWLDWGHMTRCKAARGAA